MDKLRKYQIGKSYKSAFWGSDDIGFNEEETGIPQDPDDELVYVYPKNRCEICGEMFVVGYNDDEDDSVCFSCKT